MKMLLTAAAVGAAVLVGPQAAADDMSLQITNAKLVKDNIVVQGVYSCSEPNKARFIEAEAMQYQGEDGETEVTAFKTLRDRPCTGGKRQFQVTLKPTQGAKFLPASKGGSNVYVQVEAIITDQNNVYEDSLGDGADVEV